jgi:hypothetical protein
MYANHKDIPTKYRRVILDEVFEKRVAKVPLELCNEIINSYLEEQEELESLKDFSVQYVKKGKSGFMTFKSLKETEIAMDRLIDFGEDTKNVVMLLSQAKKPIKFFKNGQWFGFKPKDYIRVKPRQRGDYVQTNRFISR